MFDVTVYTDAREDEALDGVAGFNFIAASPGSTLTDQKFIAQHMLHVVKSSWHVDHTDQLAHPPTCLYRRSDDRYFLSRGRSTGQTITAPRPGNQITQTIATADSDDFVPYRPAQLYAASQWQLSRETGGKQIAAWPTPLEIDAAYEPDELKAALVTGSPFGASFLPRFLTMVEQAVADPGKKLIIVHTELDVVMRYIALASLFLDSGRALSMSFVAFADQPLAAVADIVGATPDFGATPSAGSAAAAYNVVDLLAVQMSPVEVSQSAARQAEWFDGDALDALAAIDVARRWEAALGADVATDAAGIVSFTDGSVAAPRERASALRAVRGLVAGGLGDDLAMYADELLDAIVTNPPTGAEDIVLAAAAIGAAHQAGLDEVSTGILLPTLEVLASRSDLIPAWSDATASWPIGSAPVGWGSEDSRDHALRAQSEIVNHTDAEHLVDVLIAGKIAGLLPDARTIAPAFDRLSTYWCQHPELSNRKSDLPYQPDLGQRLTARVVSALERHDKPVVDAFAAGAWGWLSGPGSALEPWQSAVRTGALDIDRRADAITAAGAQLPEQSWPLVLAGCALPAAAAAVAAWIESHPQLPIDLSAWIFQGLNASPQRFEDGRARRRVLSMMLRVRAMTRDPGLARLLADADQLGSLYQEAKKTAKNPRNPALHSFATRVSPYIGYFCPEAGTLLVTAQDQRGVERLERAVGDWAAPCIDAAFATIARQAGDVVAVESALNLYESGTELQTDAATEFLLGLMDSRSGRHRLDELRDDLARSWVPVLDRLMEESKKGRLSRNMMRGGKRLFSKER
ncbi:hypothetical protein ACJEIK_28255 [Mycobacterium sp. SMC-16]|uniref:GAP1-N2 domain-containing protein n=1 Tax=Mycobacterium sp. SMC-16 TaxID=3385967 RepID=UPI00390C7F03